MSREEKIQAVLAEFAKTGPWTERQFYLTAAGEYHLTPAEVLTLLRGPLCLCKDRIVRQR